MGIQSLVWETQSGENGKMRLRDMKVGNDLMPGEGVWQRRTTEVGFFFVF